MTAPTADRRTGGSAVAGGLLLAASVAAELVQPVQESDGTVVSPALYAGYVTAWTLGAVALLAALLGLGAPALPRAGRIGRGIAIAGAALLGAFGAVGLVTGTATGVPAEWSFLLFVVGLLLFLVAAVPLALGLRRAGRPALACAAVVVAGAGVVIALGIEADPWHDLGLFVFCAAWLVLGVGLLRRTRRATPLGLRVG